jgi:hypothetical protein
MPELRWQWPATGERADFELALPAASQPARFFSRVWSDEKMVLRHLQARMSEQAARERREWEKVRTLDDWERFRTPRLAALRASLAPMPERTPLRMAVTRRADYGEGFISRTSFTRAVHTSW